MSAIAGLWAGADQIATCEMMLRAQARYGPDDSSAIDVGPVAVGRNLFKLLPEDEFDCGPVAMRDGQAWLVADVRLDNREELGRALDISSVELDVLSDSALLAAALTRWNWSALDKVVGDYAFALYDVRERSLHLVTDAFGQRPLFWACGKDYFAFASMPSGLLAINGVYAGPDLERVARFLAPVPVTTDQSFYRNIQRVPSGSITRYRVGRVDERRWWQPNWSERCFNRYQDAVDEYRALLDCAVKARLRGAGNRVASHLSGGWDSSAVTATAARLLAATGGSVDAFTSVPRAGADADAPFSHRFSDERSQACAVAKRYPNIVQHLIAGNRTSPIADLDDYLEAFQRPMVNLCNHVWLASIRKHARALDHRILLTGEIGNFTISASPITLFADYVARGDFRRWWQEVRAAHAQRRARWRGILAASFVPWMPDWAWSAAERFSAVRPLSFHTLLTRNYQHHLAQEKAASDRHQFKDFREATLASLRTLHFAEYHKGVLGGWGIDKRDPTADIRVVEFMLSLPPDMLLCKGERRPLARAALADRLPAEVLDEKGKGYQAGDWHEGLTDDLDRLRTLIASMAEDPDIPKLIDIPALEALIADWPQASWNHPAVVARYRNALLNAVSAGHFVLASKGKAPTN